MSITLLSNDGQSFQVSRDIIRQIGILDELFKDMGFDDDPDMIEPIPCTNINGHILKMIIDFCTHHINDPEMSEEEWRNLPNSQWDMDFLPIYDKNIFHDLYMASFTLNIKKLKDVCAKYIASLIKGRSTEEIGQILGIPCDFTPEEQEQIRQENAWADED